MILGNIENQTLLALLAYALFAQEMNIDATNVNWDQVIAEANRHGRAHRPEAPRNPRRFLRSGAHKMCIRDRSNTRRSDECISIVCKSIGINR